MKYFVLFVTIFFPFTAHALCYSPEQAEADQGLRIHSELMVIGLNCQHMAERHGDNLYLTYRRFTADNARIFAEYESRMMDFYKANTDHKPEDQLNDLRTGYANKISEDAAAMRPDVFCSQYAPRVHKAFDMTEDELRSWASTIFPSHPVSYPLCELEAKAKG